MFLCNLLILTPPPTTLTITRSREVCPYFDYTPLPAAPIAVGRMAFFMSETRP